MSQILPRLVASSFAALTFVAPWCLAQQPATLSLEAILKGVGGEDAQVVRYQDASDRAISGEEFIKLAAAGQPFMTMKKRGPDGRKEVILAITTKEKQAAIRRPDAKLKPGDKFPDFKLARLDGSAIDNKALEGRFTLVNFYFAECAPCVREVPQLNALANGRKDINYLAVTFDSVDETKKFVAGTGLSWPVVPGARQLSSDVGVRVYPSFALLDPQGRLVAFGVEPKSVAEWIDQKLALDKR